MGLGNNSGGGRKFTTIVNGKWTLRVEASTEGAVARNLTNGPNEGKEVHELYFEYLDGTIVGGEIKHGKFGVDICLDIDDEGQRFTAQIPLNSSYFSTIAKVSPNINPAEKIFLGLGTDKEKGRTFLYVKQSGETVRSAYTKDNPNGMPQAEQKTVMGTTKWDFEAQENFLYERLEEFISFINAENQQEQAAPADAEGAPDFNSDDIPF